MFDDTVRWGLLGPFSFYSALEAAPPTRLISDWGDLHASFMAPDSEDKRIVVKAIIRKGKWHSQLD